MVYCIIVLCLIIVVLFLAMLFSKKESLPTFHDIGELTSSLRSITPSGSGISLSGFKRMFEKQYTLSLSKIVKGEELFAFEKWLTDNHFKITALVHELNRAKFSLIPHVYGVPRIVIIARFAVSRGFDKSISSLIDFLKEVQKSIDLDYGELSLYRSAICFAELEKIFDIAKTSLEYEKIKQTATKSTGITSQSGEYLFFYSKTHEIPEFYKKAVSKASESFEDALISLELKIKKCIVTINESNTLSGKAILPFYSVIDKTFYAIPNYENVSIITRCAYMRRINELSNSLNMPELCIAEASVYLSSSLNIDLAEVIFDKTLLKNYLKKSKIKRGKMQTRENIYVGLILFFSLLCFFPLLISRDLASFVFVSILFFLLLSPVEYFFKRIFSHFKKMPLIACGYEKLPDNSETVVVVSQFVNSVEKMEESYNRLLSLSYNCTDEKVRYVLLVDLPAYQADKKPEEKDITNYLDNLVLENQRICILIRKRIQVDSEFVPYERKRGAILNLFEAIINNDFSKFEYKKGDLNQAKFAVLLDDDSAILPNAIHNAINTMIHPYNKKYDIMSFGAKINKYSIKTNYSVRFTDDGSIDCYPCYNDIYSDVFDAGLYCGKGIVRVKEFYQKLNGYFPDKRILSHDLIEGAILKTGSLKQSVYEDAPAHFKGDSSRYTRWLMGDVLLLPYIGMKTKNKNGEKVSNNIRPLYKLILFINATSGIRDFCFILSIFLGIVSAHYYFCLCSFLLLILPFVHNMMSRFCELFHGVRLRYVMRDIGRVLSHLFERIFFLPFYAFNGISIYLQTTFRSAFSKKSLLNWKPFFTVQGKSNFFAYSRLFLPSKILMSALALISGNPYFVAYAGLYVFYAFAVYKGKELKGKVDREENKVIEDIAKKTYSYFSSCYVNSLPIDNIQYYPSVSQTKMTSPTDMGFALLAEISACELGLVSSNDAQKKITDILSQMKTLERYKGHFYNWYDVGTLKPMSPFSISSADSANLIASLYCVISFAESRGNESLKELAKSLNNADLSLFFNENKGLLHISYFPNENRFEGFYDILQSEARLCYYIAIARGLPIIAWFNLSRNHIDFAGNTLLSWFGSCFEYLMPRIFLMPPRYSMQEKTERNVLTIQSRNTLKGCFGVSESGIREVNEDFHYKYMPNGLADLAMNFESGELVYSPYSAMLCLPYSNGETRKTLAEYVKNGMLADNGFYESISKDGNVFMQMTHHQGMILCAITNKLKNDIFCELFMQNPEMESARLLLSEPLVRTRSGFSANHKFIVNDEKLSVVQLNQELNQATLLCGEDYSIIYSSNGSNRTLIKGKDLSSFYKTAFSVEGKNTYLKFDDGRYISIYGKDACGEASNSFVRFTNSKLGVCETVKLLANGNGSIRKVSVANRGETIDLYHYFDVTLMSQDEQYSHKAFYQMFVKTKIIEDMAFFYTTNGVAVGIKVLGLSNPTINTNMLNAKKRNRVNVSEIKNIYPSEGEVLYPCYSVSGSVIQDENQSNVYFVEVYGDSVQDCLRILSKYSYDTLNDAYDLYSYKGSNIKYSLSKSYIDFFGQCLFGFPEQSELAKPIARDFLVTRFENGNSDFDEFIKACRLLKRAGVNIAVAVDPNSENTALCNELLSEYIPIRTDNVAVQSYWNKETKQPKQLRYGVIIKPNFEYEGIKSGEGFFTKDGYVVKPSNQITNKPYCNVLSNEKMGAIVSDNGVCFSWLNNSRENKISVWKNDERFDAPSETVCLWADNRLFSLTSSTGSICIHKNNESVFISEYRGVRFEVHIYIGDSQKNIIKKVVIKGKMNKKFAIVFGFQTALNWKPDGNVLVEKQANGKMCLFNKSSQMRCSMFVKDGVCFVGYAGLYERLKNNQEYIGTSDFVGIIKEFEGLEESEFCILSYGHGTNVCGPMKADKGAVRIKTNNEYLDVLFNEWLLKQVRDCRFFARASFYQCGGAYGFRDQLQDCLALLYSYPEKVKEHILLCASHQYEEGDVMHWWHPPKTGIRTRNSDDRLFLCYLICKYIDRTGDNSILNRQLPFLHSRQLSGDELSRFEQPTIKHVSESLFEHMKRALFSAMKFGANSLLLVGSGDWNDGLDKLGIKGKGESVWLSMFAYSVLTKCVDFFEGKERTKLINYMEKLKEGINKAFVIDRFIGYYTDDGEILGNSNGEFMKTYLPVQAFAVLSGAVEPSLFNIALDNALKLVDFNNGIIKIFDYPFDKTEKYGYIGRYPKGVRENGGQYTHASIWLIDALFEANRIEEAYELLCMINPVEKSLTVEGTNVYQAEPYVISADVYAESYTGRAGWSWYTGSASWYYVTIIEYMFGVKFVNGNIYFKPKLPKALYGAELRMKLSNTEYIIRFNKSDKNEIFLNGILQYSNYISPLPNKGKVFVTVNYAYLTDYHVEL